MSKMNSDMRSGKNAGSHKYILVYSVSIVFSAERCECQMHSEDIAAVSVFVFIGVTVDMNLIYVQV